MGKACAELISLKLSKRDKVFLLGLGHTENDFAQIETAMRHTKTSYELDGAPIGREKAIELLGRKKYLAGISRSAFHSSAIQYTDDGKTVYFDSHNLFRN